MVDNKVSDKFFITMVIDASGTVTVTLGPQGAGGTVMTGAITSTGAISVTSGALSWTGMGTADGSVNGSWSDPQLGYGDWYGTR